jgi:hypothetical protein
MAACDCDDRPDGVYFSHDHSSVLAYSTIAYLVDDGVRNQRFRVSYTPSDAIEWGLELVAAGGRLVSPDAQRRLAAILSNGAANLYEMSDEAG